MNIGTLFEILLLVSAVPIVIMLWILVFLTVKDAITSSFKDR